MRRDKPSRTACKVALNVVTLGVKPGMDRVLPPAVAESTARLLVASGAASPRTVRWARSPRAVAVYEAFDWMLPGQFEAFAHRKAFCERQVRDAIREGATQVLVLGAGYDTLGWRLAPEFPEVRFLEIDHPATARLKAKGIAAMGHPGNLRLIAEDLGERKLVDVLENADQEAERDRAARSMTWDPNARSVFVAEGLMMYLPPDAVHELLSQCSAMSGSGSRIAFSYIPSGADGRPDTGRFTGLVLWLQKVLGEPWTWSARPEELGPFLRRAGWTNAPELAGITGKQGVEYYAVATRRRG